MTIRTISPRRRALSTLALAAALALGAAPCALAQPTAPTAKLTIIGFAGLFQDKYTEQVIAPFQKKYPSISIAYRPVKNSAEATALLRMQKSRPTINLVIMDIMVAATGNREKLFAPLDPRKVGNLADLHPWAKTAGNYGPVISRDDLAIIYNTKLVKQAPNSWMDLAKPEFQRKLAMPVADTRGVALLPILTRMAGGDYKQSIDPGLALLKKIAPLVQTWEPQPDIYTAVRSGQAAIGIGWNGRGQYTHDISNGDVAVVIPKEGSTGQLNTINLVAGAPDADASQLFINYALSPEAQLNFSQSLFYGASNQKTALTPQLRQRIYGGADVEKRSVQLDWSWLSDRYGPWVQRIKREVIGG